MSYGIAVCQAPFQADINGIRAVLAATNRSGSKQHLCGRALRRCSLLLTMTTAVFLEAKLAKRALLMGCIDGTDKCFQSWHLLVVSE